MDPIVAVVLPLAVGLLGVHMLGLLVDFFKRMAS